MAVVQCELVQLWKSQAARLRQLYCSWKPRQRGNPFISCHVWFLPCLLATWLTVFLSILLLALYLHEKMAVDIVVWNFNLLMFVGTLLVVNLWCFAQSQYTEHTQSCHYHSHHDHCHKPTCSFCLHHGLRRSLVKKRWSYWTSLASSSMVSLLLQLLKCVRIFIPLLLILLAGDVETNPGPDGLNVQDYLSLLPESVRPFVNNKLDWDHDGVEKDLTAIAKTISNWEVQLAVKLGLTRTEIEDIRAEKHALQSVRALQKWKDKRGLRATYMSLLEVCCEAEVPDVAEAVCDMLKLREEKSKVIPSRAQVVDSIVKKKEATGEAPCLAVDTLIEVISDHIGHEWKQLARQLKFSEADIGAIEYDYRFSLKEQIFQLFYQWKERECDGASSRALLDGVRKARLHGVLQALESESILGRPKLKDGEIDDVGKDSPNDQKREEIKRLSADKTEERPFEEGDMVHVESLGYGVVKWLGFLKLKKDSLIAGVEFDEPVPGGGTGDFKGTHYFTCDPGLGLLLPYSNLKKDDRFESVSDTPISPDPIKPEENNIPTAVDEDSSAGPKMLGPHIFCIPNDHAGLLIGREGKNILEVERATNTSIKVDSPSASLGDKIDVRIMGSEENCERAFFMITQKLQQRVSLHTAASETIKVPDNMVGRIIGKDGVTVRRIKSLSGAYDIKFSERPRGFGPELERDCVITGSRDEIEEAKKLIKRVLEGEDIVTDAHLEALDT